MQQLCKSAAENSQLRTPGRTTQGHPRVPCSPLTYAAPSEFFHWLEVFAASSGTKPHLSDVGCCLAKDRSQCVEMGDGPKRDMLIGNMVIHHENSRDNMG